MNKLLQRFIVWYLKRHNAKFEHGNYVVRLFSDEYYGRLMWYAEMMNPPFCKCCLQVGEVTKENER